MTSDQESNRLREVCLEYGRRLVEFDRSGHGYFPRGYGRAKNALEVECRKLATEDAVRPASQETTPIPSS